MLGYIRVHDDKAPRLSLFVLEYSQAGIRLAYFRPDAGTKYDRPTRGHHSGPMLAHDAIYDPVIYPG